MLATDPELGATLRGGAPAPAPLGPASSTSALLASPSVRGSTNDMAAGPNE